MKKIEAFTKLSKKELSLVKGGDGIGDLSEVKVHEDRSSSSSNLQAKAYTISSDVAVKPKSEGSGDISGHELTKVVGG
jgi:bacteriocin-like protein